MCTTWDPEKGWWCILPAWLLLRLISPSVWRKIMFSNAPLWNYCARVCVWHRDGLWLAIIECASVQKCLKWISSLHRKVDGLVIISVNRSVGDNNLSILLTFFWRLIGQMMAQKIVILYTLTCAYKKCVHLYAWMLSNFFIFPPGCLSIRLKSTVAKSDYWTKYTKTTINDKICLEITEMRLINETYACVMIVIIKLLHKLLQKLKTKDLW